MKPFVSQPLLCIAACVEYIVYHKTQIEIDQSSFAEYFGVSIPKGSVCLNHIINKNESENSHLWGISIDSKRLNRYLKDRNVNLKIDYLSSKVFEDWSFEDYIKSSLVRKELILCTFEYNYLFDKSSAESYGHAIVIEGIDSRNEEYVYCYDPGPRNFGSKPLLIYDLFIASKRKDGGLFRFY
jgi:hypothetical protein